MIRIHRRISKAVTILTLSALVLTGCTSEASNIGKAKENDSKTDVMDTGFTLSTVGSYDSADTAVVLSTDSNNKAVTLINMDTGKQYTLYYDGTTYVQNKHDGPMTISQIEAGDVVDVTFLKGKKRLASIKLSPDAWVYDDVYNYDLAGANRTASIGSQTYSLPEGVVVLSGGRRVDKAEVVSQDVVTISGIDHEIYSVSVDRGHGYLRLKNDQALLGGWIEVGNKVIRQITEDMLLVVPEGSYQVALTNKNVGCVKDVTVERDKEVVLDVGDLEVAEDAVGKILFTVTPETAKVSVDGKPVDISKVVELPYGIHQVQAQASGYDTLTRHIQVGSEYATISFKLEESRQSDNSNNSVSDNSTSRIPWQDTLDSVKPKEKETANTGEDTYSSVSQNALGTSNEYKVYIDSPEGAIVYLDGKRKGTVPVRFTKEPGSHQITFEKDGKKKTLTFYFEDDKRDITIAVDSSIFDNVKVSDTISSNIISTIATDVANCDLTNGPDAFIPTPFESKGNLTPSGKEKIENVISDAIEKVVGTEGKKSYTKIEVNDALEDMKVVQETGNYQGKASVTIGREGYKDQKVSVWVVIKNYIVTVSSVEDKVKLKPGESLQFIAKVKNSENSFIENPQIRWEVKEADENGGTVIDTSGKLTIGFGELASEIIVTATYMDGDIAKGSGEVAVVIEKTTSEITVEITSPLDTVEVGKEAELKAIVKQGEEEIVNPNIRWQIRDQEINGDKWIPETAGEADIKVTYTDGTGKEYSASKIVTVKPAPNTPQNVDSADMEMETTGESVTNPEVGNSTETGNNPESDGNTESGDDLETSDNSEIGSNPETGGDSESDVDTESSSGVGNDENTTAGDNPDSLTTETVTVNQNAHPIRKFFSSLFK